MPESAEPPVNQRLRTVRRRIAAATLATFVAAWLAVAALGRGGSTGSTAATDSSSGGGTATQNDDGGTLGAPSNGDSYGYGDDGYGNDGYGSPDDHGGFSGGGDGSPPNDDAGGSADAGSSQSGQAGPLTTGQS